MALNDTAWCENLESVFFQTWDERPNPGEAGPVEATAAKRPVEVARMFDFVAPRYDLMNALLSAGHDAHWRRATTSALAVRSGERVLDLAAGTGTSTVPLCKAGGQVWALDRSVGMVIVGRKRLANCAHNINFTVGDAAALPFADDMFDAVTVSFGLRNMPAPVEVLRQLARVTKPGGRIVICEFSTPVPALLRSAYRTWLGRVMPLAAQLSSHPASYRYLAQSILDWPPQTTVADWMAEAGWKSVAYKNLTGGIVALHKGWR